MQCIVSAVVEECAAERAVSTALLCMLRGCRVCHVDIFDDKKRTPRVVLCRECQRYDSTYGAVVRGRVPLERTCPLFKSVFSSTHAISHRSRAHQSEIGTVKQPRGGLREREMPLDGVTEGQSHTP